MIYNDLIDDIKSADYVLFGLGKEIYSSDDTEIYDNLKKLFASMEHVNYFIVSTDKAGTIRNCGLNERRIVCPVNENNAEEEEKQWDFYNKWLSSSLAKKLVIVELGEDFSNPNVIRLALLFLFIQRIKHITKIIILLFIISQNSYLPSNQNILKYYHKY